MHPEVIRFKKGSFNMRNLMVGCFVCLFATTALLGLFSTGCGSSNNTAAPVTVTNTLQPTPTCGGQLGWVSVGGGISYSSGYINCFPVTLGAASKTLDMAIYLGSSPTGNIELSVYSDSSGAPNTHLDGGIITSPVASSWNIATLGGQNLAAGKYWLAVESQNSIWVAYGTSQTGTLYEVTQSYGIPPLTMPAGTSSSATPAAIVLNTVCQ